MGYVGLEEDYCVSVKSVLDITAETGALTTQSRIRELTPADVVPYTIAPDGTLTITVPKGTEVSRVLVQEDGTQWGGLFYAD